MNSRILDKDAARCGHTAVSTHHRWHGRPSSQVIWLRRQYRQAWFTLRRFAAFEGRFLLLPETPSSSSCSLVISRCVDVIVVVEIGAGGRSDVVVGQTKIAESVVGRQRYPRDRTQSVDGIYWR